MLRHLPALGEALVGEVDLDDEVDVPLVHVRRSRRVRAPLLLPVLVRVGQRDVLADGKAEDVLGGGKAEAEHVGVVRQLRALHQLQRHLLAGIQRFFSLWGERVNEVD